MPHNCVSLSERDAFCCQVVSQFGQAHAIVGQLVLKGLQTGTTLQEIPLAEYQKIMPEIGADVYHDLQSKVAVARRQSLGGTSFENVKKQIKAGKKLMGME